MVGNAVEVTCVTNVEWAQQPDGSYSAWGWVAKDNGGTECFLVYMKEPDGEELIEQLADLFVAAAR